jgi:small subunit ribosomal protein S16
MLMIRLNRTGKKNSPFYSIVVTEKSNPASDGNFLEKLGTYSPSKKDITVNKDRIEHWIKNGAHPTETIARLLNKQGFKGMERFVDLNRNFKKKSDKEPEVAAAPAEAAAPEAPAEAPTETPAA